MDEITRCCSIAGTTVCSLILLRFYLNCFFKEQDSKIKILLGWAPFYLWQCCINAGVFEMMMSPTERLFLTVITLLSVSVIAYQGGIWKKFILSAVYIALWMLLESIIWFYLGDGKAMLYILAVSVISKSLLFAIITGLHFYMKRREQASEIIAYGRALLAISLGSIGLYYILAEMGLEADSEKAKIRICFMAGALILIAANISMYMLYVKMVENQQASQNRLFYLQKMESFKQQHIELAVAEIRETRHNFKHRLRYLENLAAYDMEHFREAIGKTIDEILLKGEIVGTTGCQPVDFMLLDAMKRSVESKIRLHPRVNIPPEVEIDENDFSVLLGNALDNAMEAVESLAETLRDIYIEMEYNQGVLNIEIKNRYQGELQWLEYGKRLKSKKQKGIHGLGLKSIEKIAAKYHGEMKVFQQDGFFILKIWMCA